VLIAGVDLAAEPKATALCLIDWGAHSASVARLGLDISDETIVGIAADTEKIGLDCALGWPTDFVDFLNNVNVRDAAPEPFLGDLDFRRNLAFRETDRMVHAETGRWPLSVSTDRLGMTAVRCAGLLSQLSAAGVQIDKSGGGKVVEIYPGATLRIWGLDTSGYRQSKDVRVRLVEAIRESAPKLFLGGFVELMIESCDAFDSVVAALAARAAYLGAYKKPTKDQLGKAQIEGWIALPTKKLDSL
jgi:predicted nuclease with RNAse H fold